MKRLILVLLTMIFALNGSFSQNTVQKITYWDVWKTKKQRVWHELGDGTWHGDVKEYGQDGILVNYSIMNYGVLKSKTWYFQDGTVFIKINNNDKGKKEGIQELYNFINGKRFLKAKAVVTNDVVKDYKSYYKENVLQFSYSNNGNNSYFKGGSKNSFFQFSFEIVSHKRAN
jgi:antitoxin component YwqK of YwqJK toxin-antitoxin module